MNFFLVSTEHLENALLFQDEDDYRAAMNMVAICAFTTGVKVIAFILMSNHVHFVLMCSREDSKLFTDRFKMLYGKHFCRKYGAKNFLRRLEVDTRELYLNDDSLPRGIAYVQVNCVAANLAPSASLFPWGTGATFFNVAPASGQKLGELSRRQQHKILHTKVDLPQDYLLSSTGYVLPCSYVPVEFVESLFRSPNRYNYYLSTSSKSKRRLDKDAAPSFSDYIVKGAIQDLTRSLFRTDNFDNLSSGQQAELIRQLQRRFSADPKQLARCSGLTLSEINRMLDAFIQ